MHIAILTFQGFNELDSLIALGVLNRVKKPDWRVTLCCPEPEVTSMNGVTVRAVKASMPRRRRCTTSRRSARRRGSSPTRSETSSLTCRANGAAIVAWKP
jgi:hypothetical protein